MEKLEPIRRDFLTEAIKIIEGANPKAIRREHLEAMYRAYLVEATNHLALQKRMKSLLDQALKMRSAKGLSTQPPTEKKL